MAKRTKKHMRQPEVIEPDLFADEFFSEPPKATVFEPVWDERDEPEARPRLAPNNQRAMHATIAIFGVFALAVGAFVVYTQLIMPTPVALVGASSATFTLPTAPIVEPAQPTPAPVFAAAPVQAMQPHVEAPAHLAAAPAPAAPAAPAAEIAQIEPPATPKPRRAPVANVASAPANADSNSLSAQAMRALNTGRASDARRLAQQAVQTNPERADGWIVLGAASDALGDHAAAKDAYATCTARAFGPRVTTCRALAR